MVSFYRSVLKRKSTATTTAESGTAYTVDQWRQLTRFLILGSVQGTFYAKPRQVTEEALALVRTCLDSDASRTVREIVAVSDSGRGRPTTRLWWHLRLPPAIRSRRTTRLRRWIGSHEQEHTCSTSLHSSTGSGAGAERCVALSRRGTKGRISMRSPIKW